LNTLKGEYMDVEHLDLILLKKAIAALSKSMNVFE
jgi:hypothetical protein